MPKVVVVLPPHPDLDTSLLSEFGVVTSIYPDRRKCNVFDPKLMRVECEMWAETHWEEGDLFAFVGPVVATALAYCGVTDAVDRKSVLIWSNERKTYEIRKD